MYFSAELPRVRAGTGWTDLVIESEVGVVATSRGYVPALKVRRGDSEQILFVGAASLAQELERIRASVGHLKGSGIRIRKVRADKTAPYEVEVV